METHVSKVHQRHKFVTLRIISAIVRLPIATCFLLDNRIELRSAPEARSVVESAFIIAEVALVDIRFAVVASACDKNLTAGGHA